MMGRADRQRTVAGGWTYLREQAARVPGGSRRWIASLPRRDPEDATLMMARPSSGGLAASYMILARNSAPVTTTKSLTLTRA